MNTALPALCGTLLLLAGDAGAKGPSRKGPHVFINASGGRLGAQVQSMTEDLRGYFGAPTDAGVLVGEVEADSPAAKAGLKVGDVVVDVDGDKIDSPTDLMSELGGKNGGAKVTLGIVRDKKRQSLTATLRDRGNAQAQAFGFDMDSDMDMKIFDMPDGFHGFAFGGRADQIEKLQKKIEDLSRRLEKLEGKTK